MVEENEIRADLSPWERGRIAVTARDAGLFDTIAAAVERGYADLNCHALEETKLRTPEANGPRSCPFWSNPKPPTPSSPRPEAARPRPPPVAPGRPRATPSESGAR